MMNVVAAVYIRTEKIRERREGRKEEIEGEERTKERGKWKKESEGKRERNRKKWIKWEIRKNLCQILRKITFTKLVVAHDYCNYTRGTQMHSLINYGLV